VSRIVDSLMFLGGSCSPDQEVHRREHKANQ
jgi:hypothetical protein